MVSVHWYAPSLSGEVPLIIRTLVVIMYLEPFFNLKPFLVHNTLVGTSLDPPSDEHVRLKSAPGAT